MFTCPYIAAGPGWPGAGPSSNQLVSWGVVGDGTATVPSGLLPSGITGALTPMEPHGHPDRGGERHRRRRGQCGHAVRARRVRRGASGPGRLARRGRRLARDHDGGGRAACSQDDRPATAIATPASSATAASRVRAGSRRPGGASSGSSCWSFCWSSGHLAAGSLRGSFCEPESGSPCGPEKSRWRPTLSTRISRVRDIFRSDVQAVGRKFRTTIRIARSRSSPIAQEILAAQQPQGARWPLCKLLLSARMGKCRENDLSFHDHEGFIARERQKAYITPKAFTIMRRRGRGMSHQEPHGNSRPPRALASRHRVWGGAGA